MGLVPSQCCAVRAKYGHSAFNLGIRQRLREFRVVSLHQRQDCPKLAAHIGRTSQGASTCSHISALCLSSTGAASLARGTLGAYLPTRLQAEGVVW